MALPIALNHGWCSILLQVSPNSILSNEPFRVKNGIISAVIDTGKDLTQ